MKYFNTISGSLIFMLAFFLVACKNSKKKSKSPDVYNFNLPEKFNMPGSLLEISGICFKKGNPDTLVAIQDEDGKLFQTVLGQKDAYPTKFAKKGDYEDVAVVGEMVYVLRSDGVLFSFKKPGIGLQHADSVKEWKSLFADGEYEGMYGDELAGKLYIICKDCPADDNSGKLPGYIVDVHQDPVVSSLFSIDMAAIQFNTKKTLAGFRPAALAKNPVTGEWFILSGSNKMLVITDTAWKVKSVYPLNGNTFHQAEGIAFDNEGNLYISNEGDEVLNGNVLKFLRMKKED